MPSNTPKPPPILYILIPQHIILFKGKNSNFMRPARNKKAMHNTKFDTFMHSPNIVFSLDISHVFCVYVYAHCMYILTLSQINANKVKFKIIALFDDTYQLRLSFIHANVSVI